MVHDLLASIAVAPVEGGVFAAMLAVAVSAMRPKAPEPQTEAEAEQRPTPLAVHIDRSKPIRMADDNGHATIIAAIVAAVGAIGAAVAPRIFKNKPDKDGEDKFVSGLSRVDNLLSRLADLEEFGAERVILFRGHNSGGFPAPGMPFYVSASQWHTAKGRDDDQISNYRNLMVDSEYIKMLLGAWASESKYTYMLTKLMPSCQLRRYYEAEGVTCSALFMMGIRDRKMFYISAAKYSGEFTEIELTQMQLAVNGIWQDMTGGAE